MKQLAILLVTSLGLAAACSDAPTGEAQARETVASTQVQPVVVELFQSQGCSSCPPADRNVNAIAGDPNILALNFSVTYWDRLGWKDTFGQQVFTDRQWDYAHASGRPRVYTPQVIVNGRTAIVGSNPEQLAQTIRRAGPLRGPAIHANGGKLTVAAGKTPRPATVWLVRYDPRVQDVEIKAGENGGKTLPHRNIVHELTALGTWNGAAASYTLPTHHDPALRSAVLVQVAKGGPMIGAAKL